MTQHTISTETEAQQHVNALRDELTAVYMEAYSHSFQWDMATSTQHIAQALSNFIINQSGWAQGEKPGSFTYNGKHTFFLEPNLFSAKGLGWMPIETAKNIVRWELEELVQLDDEQTKTVLIADAVGYVERAGWEYSFVRRRVQN